jgi:hypothetical protein
MGTYMYCQLKNTSESHIKDCNEQLRKLGFESKVFNGILYGAFVTREQLDEDSRFMNKDPEGLKQCPHFKRPITHVFLQEFFWNRIGLCCIKLSSSEESELRQALIVAKWANKNNELINHKESNHYKPSEVKYYLL